MYIRSQFKIILFYSNLLSSIINTFFLIHYKIKNKKVILYFKNIDYFNIGLINSTYKTISDYLNKKYNYKNSKINNFKNGFNKKKIKINCVDLFNINKFKKWLDKYLKDRFHIIYDTNKPDYLIFNVFGDDHLKRKYENAVKIAIYTENFIPNLDYADYAIGHSHIIYLDRYFKHSIFLWKKFEEIKNARKNALNNSMKKKFCAAVISNDLISDKFRLEFIKELEKYKIIDMGGKYKNNIGGPIKNKIEFLSTYKFSIAMENSNGDGYISEKIVDSFLAGTIPIYYGDYMVDEYINPKSYILIKGKKDLKKKIDYIIKIDNDIKLYKRIMKEKVVINDNFINEINNNLKQFLINIFFQDKNKAFRANG